MANLAIPATVKSGLAAALVFLADPIAIKTAAQKADEIVVLIVKTIREAAEPNPWKDADDETIAEELLRRIDERTASKRAARGRVRGSG